MDLKATLNLPSAEATIPMKANLPSLEPSIQAIWEEGRLYHAIQDSRRGAPTFVLHDGPPYTNSEIHMGTALNKILKDFVVKSRTMMGYRAPYIPGFDNHGLPIELRVAKKLQESKQDPSDRQLLIQACRDHAQQYIKIQTDQFKRLGVLGLWENPYCTMGFKYEAELVRVFKRLVEAGLVYRGLRPTLWSPTSRTALADTEIVYQDHTSKAIYVRFALRQDPNRLLEAFDNVYTIIWTTTPWTIPANLAVAFHPDFDYAVVRVQEGPGDHAHYVVLDAAVQRLAEELGWGEYEIVHRLQGINLDHAEFSHPIFDRPSLAVMADYVTTDDGTGVVHTAPSHGRDDFFTGQKYGLPVPNTVDERGVLTAETGEFEGTYFKDCDRVVVERLAEVGALLKSYDYFHSYPYAERDKQPVIFRATEQWFVAIDPLRPQMGEEIERVEWFPESGQNRIEAMVRNRPDWCVSRQRPWGVGIPIFYGKESGVPVLDPAAIESVANVIELEGSVAWFTREPSELLPEGYRHPETGETEFRKETDTLDVWFDSGSSSICVLEGNVEPDWERYWPADLYFEGSDQHRGWFNTSLIIGTALNGHAPYKAVVTHGFVVDSEGRKMSKSLGNVVDPVKASETYGADILRTWVASVDYTNDVPCTDALLKQLGENYRNIRNTLRFLLGNLEGYVPGDDELLDLDEWVCEQTDLLVADCVDAYARYEFGTVINAIHNFCREELSKFYLDAIKDRMYCDGKDWPSRKSGQRACLYVLKQLVRLVAPILVHTAEETWTKMREQGLVDGDGSVHIETFNAPSEERMASIEESALQGRFATLKIVREQVLAAFEPYKGTEGIKDTQDVIVTLTDDGDAIAALRSFAEYDLANYFKVSWVELREGEDGIEFRPSPYPKCERSRLRRPEVAEVEFQGERIMLTPRDRRAVGA